MSEQPLLKQNKLRLLAFVALMVCAACFGCYKLMGYQIVQGAEYASKAENTSVIKTTEYAGRGDILDRYGRTLATSKLVINIDISYSTMPKGQENEVILRLTQLFEQNGQEWIDNFPIILQSGEYQYESDMDSEIEKVKDLLKLQSYATAQNCMDNIIENYKIKGYTDEETLKIGAVRVMMDLEGFSDSKSYTFAEDVDQSFAMQLAELSDYVPGVVIAEDYTREYPNGTIAPHLIGYTGAIPEGKYEIAEEDKAEGEQDYKDKEYAMDDIVGITGIEYYMEDELRGIDGVKETTIDADGNITEKIEQEAKAGNSVQLTLDSGLQSDIQGLLEQYIKNWRNTSAYRNTEGGSVVVLDVNSGGVLASVNYPSYDINTFSEEYSNLAADTYKPLLDRAFQGLYRPGSTFKTVVGVAGLSEGVITTSTTFRCNHKFSFDWDMGSPKLVLGCLGTHGSISLYSAIEHSCNIYFYNVGDKLNDLTRSEENGSNAKLVEYSNALGLGTDIGLEVNSSTGYIASPEVAEKLNVTWNRADAAQSAIGQSETMVSPVQMATSAATIANRGTRYNTHVVKQILSYDGETVIQNENIEILSQLENTNNAFDEVYVGMKRAAVSYGLGPNVAAKTGTPQQNNKTYNSATIAVYPADNPEIAFAIMIENSDKGQAKTMVTSIIEAYEASKLNIPEEYKNQ